jgi:demethylmenaquinone methyltransferase/2-methoxy-6-polyprenyl-1,4-benzoquinol methylase
MRVMKPIHSDTRAAYDRLSRWYDWIAGSEEGFVRQAIGLLALRPGERVVEIGCGTGKALVEMAAQTGISGLVLGVDLSAGMLRRASERAGGQPVRLCQSDALALPCPDGSCDAVLMTFTLELFTNAEMAPVLAEIRRVLRPGGRLGIAALLETDAPRWMERLYGVFHRRFPRLVDCRPIRAGRMLVENGFILQHQERQSMWGLPLEIVVAEK